MLKVHRITSITVLIGGLVALSGCSHQAPVSGGVPIPPPSAAPPMQVQIQQVENDPHIPAARKPGIEATIAANNASGTNKKPAGQ